MPLDFRGDRCRTAPEALEALTSTSIVAQIFRRNQPGARSARFLFGAPSMFDSSGRKSQSNLMEVKGSRQRSNIGGLHERTRVRNQICVEQSYKSGALVTPPPSRPMARSA